MPNLGNRPLGLLIVGYGNTLRCDDGVGPQVADAVGALNLTGVTAMTCDLLAPEMAVPISQAEAVVFVDAAVDTPLSDGVLLRDLEPADSSQIIAHSADPRTMLAIARDVFGHAPRAWWLTIPAANIAIGEQLSPCAQKGKTEAIEIIRKLAADRCSSL